MSLDKMGDVKAEQFAAAVLNHAKGIEGVSAAIEAKPMPQELLQQLQTGVGSQRQNTR